MHTLRRVANRGAPRDPAKRRRELLLHDRVLAVRTELLEIADTLEQTPNPNPSTVASLHELLTDGCDSPLYNSDVHPSELRATLYYALVGLSPGSPSIAPDRRRIR